MFTVVTRIACRCWGRGDIAIRIHRRRGWRRCDLYLYHRRRGWMRCGKTHRRWGRAMWYLFIIISLHVLPWLWCFWVMTLLLEFMVPRGGPYDLLWDPRFFGQCSYLEYFTHDTYLFMLIILATLGVTTWPRCPPWVQGGWVPKWWDYLLAFNARCLHLFQGVLGTPIS